MDKLLEDGHKLYLISNRVYPHYTKPYEVTQKELYEVVCNMEKKKVILDTDMYNEIDDQFALTYLMKSLDIFDLEATTIAPFSKN